MIATTLAGAVNLFTWGDRDDGRPQESNATYVRCVAGIWALCPEDIARKCRGVIGASDADPMCDPVYWAARLQRPYLVLPELPHGLPPDGQCYRPMHRGEVNPEWVASSKEDERTVLWAARQKQDGSIIDCDRHIARVAGMIGGTVPRSWRVAPRYAVLRLLAGDDGRETVLAAGEALGAGGRGLVDYCWADPDLARYWMAGRTGLDIDVTWSEGGEAHVTALEAKGAADRARVARQEEENRVRDAEILRRHLAGETPEEIWAGMGLDWLSLAQLRQWIERMVGGRGE